MLRQTIRATNFKDAKEFHTVILVNFIQTPYPATILNKEKFQEQGQGEHN